jgi:hypothetical protein
MVLFGDGKGFVFRRSGRGDDPTVVAVLGGGQGLICTGPASQLFFPGCRWGLLFNFAMAIDFPRKRKGFIGLGSQGPRFCLILVLCDWPLFRLLKVKDLFGHVLLMLMRRREWEAQLPVFFFVWFRGRRRGPSCRGDPTYPAFELQDKDVLASGATESGMGYRNELIGDLVGGMATRTLNQHGIIRNKTRLFNSDLKLTRVTTFYGNWPKIQGSGKRSSI